MSSIFISYRREDSADISGRIYDQLEARFGSGAIFKDVDAIPAGVDFRQHLTAALTSCAAALVIIGPRWLDARNAQGARRIDDAADFVRVEVETLLQRETPIIPILTHGTLMPAAADLPPSIASLSYINALPVRADPDFRRDIDRVVRAVEGYVPSSRGHQAPAPEPAATSGAARASFEVRSNWSTFGGQTISVAAAKEGRIESNHRMLPWAPWPDAVDAIQAAFQSADPTCQRRISAFQPRPAIRKLIAYLQVDFVASTFTAEVGIHYRPSGNGFERITLAITAPDRATIDMLVTRANRGGTNIMREIR